MKVWSFQWLLNSEELEMSLFTLALNHWFLQKQRRLYQQHDAGVRGQRPVRCRAAHPVQSIFAIRRCRGSSRAEHFFDFFCNKMPRCWNLQLCNCWWFPARRSYYLLQKGHHLQFHILRIQPIHSQVQQSFFYLIISKRCSSIQKTLSFTRLTCLNIQIQIWILHCIRYIRSFCKSQH